MPKRYESMRDEFAKEMPLAAAKTKAAKIFNATRKRGETPVGPGLHSVSKKGGKR